MVLLSITCNAQHNIIKLQLLVLLLLINAYTVKKKNFVKSVAVSKRHWKFSVMVTKMYSDNHYLPQISLPFHQVFLYGVCIMASGVVVAKIHFFVVPIL